MRVCECGRWIEEDCPSTKCQLRVANARNKDLEKGLLLEANALENNVKDYGCGWSPSLEGLSARAKRLRALARDEHRECGLCGRETLPDGDCYGCEGDRVHARLKVLEVYLETECSDLCAPQADQPYAVEEAVPHMVATFRAHIKKLETKVDVWKDEARKRRERNEELKEANRALVAVIGKYERALAGKGDDRGE